MGRLPRTDSAVLTVQATVHNVGSQVQTGFLEGSVEGTGVRFSLPVSLAPGADPGAATIERNPQGRVGRIEELQNLAAFLMSDGCDWLSGETIAMDGAQALATGGNFYELRKWSDAEWQAAREAIQALNVRDRAARGG